ncbi:unnamed protein product [Mytilus edulis]|uniref:Uncharacterized protein n=1 Tax=Mytilus edulis TaxID=6550 RepID=A0A8S3URG7_MYTED|nr:unnamed protein product [Mytilus edulis]
MESVPCRTFTEIKILSQPRRQDHYEESREWHTRQIKKFWSTVDAVIDTANSLKDNNLQELQEVQRELTLHVDQFSALCTIYLEFLMKYNTNESLQEKSYFETTFRGYKILIDASLRSLRHRISDALRKDTDRGSVSSSRRSEAKTSSSRNTSTSSVYLKSKAKAEAAKVRLQYVQEEAELKKKQANLDEQFEIETAKFKAAAQKEKAELNAELEVLAYKKEVAAAEAEVEVLQSEGSDERTERSCSGIKSIASKRTQAYVAEQSSLKLNSVLQPGPEFEIPYMVPNCPSSGTVKCDICSSNHATALHVDNFQRNFNTPPRALSSNGGESLQNPEPNSTTPVVKAICSQVCGDYFSGKSCAKTVLVTIYQKNQRANAVRTYALIDDQSNRSLMKPELSALLNAQGDEITYTLSSCSGKFRI